ncbi:MAG: efflux RND transporter periplasmic adaptor subunit [Syntrophomonadaceae bacterium]|nr:efflux RND transporter periplasmic adaptor subunit [Syntrophomonadaceae bacterium]
MNGNGMKQTGYRTHQRHFKVLSILLLGILVLSLMVSGCSKEEEKVKESAFSIIAATAQKLDMAQALRYGGSLRGTNEVYIYPKIASPLRVTGIMAQPGDQVSVGQTLVTLDSSDYQAKLKQAEAGLAAALAGKRISDANLEALKAKYERTKQLYEQGAVSKQDMEAMQAAYDGAIAGTADASVALSQAQLEDVQIAAAHCNITSPINGVVGSINLALGDMAAATSVAASVSDTTTLETDVMVSENDISYIKAGSGVEVYVRPVSAKPFKGKVATVAMMPDPVKRNYRVKVVLDNKDGKIKSGMYAEVVVYTEAKNKVLAVPVQAVIPRDNTNVVFIVDKNSRAQEREVKLGVRNDQYAEITSGLKAGEKVITKGNTLVNKNTLVKVISGEVK